MSCFYIKKPTDLTIGALLEQVIEECGELVQASAKYLRLARGENPSPASKDEAIDHLKEELADVSLCVGEFVKAVGWRYPVDKMIQEKYERWTDRLNGWSKDGCAVATGATST